MRSPPAPARLVVTAALMLATFALGWGLAHSGLVSLSDRRRSPSWKPGSRSG